MYSQHDSRVLMNILDRAIMGGSLETVEEIRVVSTLRVELQEKISNTELPTYLEEEFESHWNNAF